MSKEKMMDILKGALFLEYRGKALYKAAAEKSTSASAKELFFMMVGEEEKHVEILNNQLQLISKGGHFDLSGLEEPPAAQTKEIITDKISKDVSAAGYESAIIGAALELEKSAVKFYSDKEAEVTAPDEKKLFNWLVKWETEHMEMLAKIDNDIKEQVWYDNNFWPLD